ncbi:MAG: type II toxin-antitoxin system PrlF family antitoxin [Gammaproteobacteria bacterium SHHR-1]|uniref:type II toxin-antitoxin system PrlF family antitoxin n=1 Tax=Magnetovirga frankeli TaxID=947516 RepID=UPI0012930046|nr:type II toxin-antitoxin system PrlF family antitoxin [gamma proteobacterium SS-5]
MSSIHEVTTVTSKGQITLPKPIRQALGVEVGSKVAFDFSGGRVTVSRVEEVQHTDPAIAQFLSLLERDICTANGIGNLPAELLDSMQASLGKPVDWDEEIQGDVAL